jgi:predicted component of type VI protein secretion system
MPHDSLPPIGAPREYHDQPSGERRRPRTSLRAVGPDPIARRAPSHVLTALACARALLDELETVLDARDDERTQSDVVIQVAEDLSRLANLMKQWKSAGP